MIIANKIYLIVAVFMLALIQVNSDSNTLTSIQDDSFQIKEMNQLKIEKDLLEQRQSNQPTQQTLPSLRTEIQQDEKFLLLKQSLIQSIKKENVDISQEELNRKVNQYLTQNGDELVKKISVETNQKIVNAESEQEKEKIMKATIAGIAASIAPILINSISATAISAVGFTVGGVAAGSIAATIQGTMGGVIASGETFALLQSAGATGAGIFGSTLGLPLLVAGAVIGAGVGAYFYFS